MAWVEPQYSRGRVDRAGAALLDVDTDTAQLDEALLVINNWRSAHAFPLNTFQSTLRNKARRFNRAVLVAQRTKRLVSIEAKLRNEKWLKLSQMQDIGGCRAILNSNSNVRNLVTAYQQSSLKHELLRVDDYISHPRDSGYRGIHLIYRYFSDRKSTYNGLRIEVQIRSTMQHVWATAVETVGTYLSQSLKASQGSEDWLHFFALMGTWMAVLEGSARTPNTPDDDRELKTQIRYYADLLDVEERLETYSQVTQLTEALGIRGKAAFTYFLLVLEPKPGKSQVNVIPFHQRSLADATEEYARREQEMRKTPGGEAVLVAVEQLSVLRRAYPNYFLDTKAFLAEVRRARA